MNAFGLCDSCKIGALTWLLGQLQESSTLNVFTTKWLRTRVCEQEFRRASRFLWVSRKDNGSPSCSAGTADIVLVKGTFYIHGGDAEPEDYSQKT